MIDLRHLELDAPEIPRKKGDPEDFIRHMIMSFADEIPRTLYIIHQVMKKFLEKNYKRDMYWALEDLYPENKNISFDEFERAMRYATCLSMFDRKKRGKLSVYKLI